MHKTTQDLLNNLSADELALLERRAKEIARRNQDEDLDDDIITGLSFQLASEQYAIPVQNVREVRPLKQLTRVPFAPPFVVGVINLRGNILSLIDIRHFFGIAGDELTDLISTIVIEAGGLEVGIMAYRVHEVTLIKRTELTTPPATVNGVDAEFIDGVTPDGTIVLNLSRIMSDPRMIVNENSL